MSRPAYGSSHFEFHASVPFPCWHRLQENLVAEAIEWTLESAYVALTRADCRSDFFKTQHLESSKDKSQAGWFVVTLQKFTLVHHLLALAAKLELSLLSQALALVSTPSAWDSNFPKPEVEEDAESEGTSKGGPEAAARLAKLREEQRSFFSFVRSIMEGDFNEDLNGICGGKNFKLVDEIYKGGLHAQEIGDVRGVQHSFERAQRCEGP